MNNEVILRVLPNKRVKISYPDLELLGSWNNLDVALNKINRLMNERGEEFPIYVYEVSTNKKYQVDRDGKYINNEGVNEIRPFHKINWKEVYGKLSHNEELFSGEDEKGMFDISHFERNLSKSELEKLKSLFLVYFYENKYPIFYETEIPTYGEFIGYAQEQWDK